MVESNTINAGLLRNLFLAGAKNLESKREWINELNVFPVPDGDTGTNMTMTIMSAVREVNELSDPTMKELAKAISSGSLRGARGNSGVILSQLIRGFSREIGEKKELDIQTLAAAFVKATDTAYKAVMRPKEGTILTVARGIADKAVELSEEEGITLNSFLEQTIEHGNYVLSQTPEMLPVLKEAGVVDSGGQGLMTVLEGAYANFTGKEIDLTFDTQAASKPVVKISKETEEEIEFGYCTEFIVVMDHAMSENDEQNFKDYLTSIGNSIVVVADDDIVKVHVHTNDPGLAIQKGLSYGSLSNMKIDNMREEHQEKVIKEAEREAAMAAKEQKPVEPEKEIGFISVATGEGFLGLFNELGVDEVIYGGQTMNPSTEDILNAIAKVPAKNVFVLPNNKNIVLAANQAADLTEDRNVIVIPSKTIPQGIAAMLCFDPEMSVEENTDAFGDAITGVKTVELTYAVRDTTIDEVEIHEGNIMAVGDDGILAVGDEVECVALEAVAKMVDEDTEMISIYYGADYSEEAATSLSDKLGEVHTECDVDVEFGGQPIYYCIISAE